MELSCPLAAPMTIAIKLNGTARNVPEGMQIAELCVELELRPEQVAVEVNRRIVRRDQHAATPLAEGDEVEIVTLVGGG